MPSPQFNVLYIDHCNSARSIMAEALLNHHSGPEISAYSAGDQPAESVHPIVVEQLVRAGISTSGLRTKSWDVFTRPESPTMQCVITVWDDTSPQPSPPWPGHPVTANWGISDPLYLASIAIPEREINRAFTGAFTLLEKHIQRLVELPLASLNPSDLISRLNQIGHS